MTNKDKKIAVYGAIQRLLNKLSEKYPYNSEDFGFEVGYCPDIFRFEIGLIPNIMEMGEDYTEYATELGDHLLQELMTSDIVGEAPKRERLFAADIKFNVGDDDAY